MLDREKDLKERGLENHHYLFTTETKSDVERILSARKEKKSPVGAVKRLK